MLSRNLLSMYDRKMKELIRILANSDVHACRVACCKVPSDRSFCCHNCSRAKSDQRYGLYNWQKGQTLLTLAKPAGWKFTSHCGKPMPWVEHPKPRICGALNLEAIRSTKP